MSKRARMRDQERRREQFRREHARKESGAYLKGPKPSGRYSPVWETQHAEPEADRSAVGYQPEPSPFAHVFYQRYEPPRPTSLESRMTGRELDLIHLLPPLPSDGGVELVLQDKVTTEYVLVGGWKTKVHARELMAACPAAYVTDQNTKLLNRSYVYGSGVYLAHDDLAQLFGIPEHRVHGRIQLHGQLNLSSFLFLANPLAKAAAVEYVAEALIRAAAEDKQTATNR